MTSTSTRRHARPLPWLILGCALITSVPGVECDGPHPALSEPFKADWVQAPLDQVLATVAKRLGMTLVPSDGIAKRIAAKETVTLVDAAPRPLNAVLADLEADQELYAAGTDDRLAVSTADEADAPQATNTTAYLDMRPWRPLNVNMMIEVGRLTLGDRASRIVSMEEFQGRLAVVGPRQVRATLLRNLVHFRDQIQPRLTMQATFGLVPADKTIATGLLPLSEAVAIRDSLGGCRTIVCEAVSGQDETGDGAQTNPQDPGDADLGQDVRQQAHVAGLDVVSYNYDPKMGTVRTGRRAWAQSLPGMDGTLMQVALEWSDLQSLRSAPFIHPGMPRSEDEKGPAIGERERQTFTVDLPSVWTWKPALRARLPVGSALILATAHPKGQAVIILEQVGRPTISIPRVLHPLPGDASLGRQLRALAEQCGAGLSLPRACALAVDLGAVVKLPADGDWRSLLRAFAGLVLVPAGDRLRILPAGSERLETICIPVGDLIQHPGSRSHPGIALPGGAALPPRDDLENQLTAEQLIDCMKRLAGGFDTEGPAIQILGSNIILTERPKRILRCLDALLDIKQRFASRTLVWRLHTITGVPGGTILDAQQWSALPTSKRPCVATFITGEGQQDHHFAGLRQAFIEDTDVNQSIQLPLVSFLHTGLCCSVIGQPLDQGGMEAQVELQTAALLNMGRRAITIAGKPMCELDCPEVSLQTAKRTGRIPDGGALVLVAGEQTYALTCTLQLP